MKPSPLPSETLAASTHSLLSGERVLVLASSRAGQPWCACVYFAHRGNRFYFFSSPDSRHILELQLQPEAAAAVTIDHPDWRLIQGVQLQGRVEAVRGAAEKFSALKAYLRKFPFVKGFIREQAAAGRLTVGKLLGESIFVFVATEAFRLDNRRGFGHRTRVNLG